MKLDGRVVGLGCLRLGASSETYFPPTSVDGTPDEQHAAVDRIFRQALGQVGEIQEGDYGILDGVDEHGDIIADYGVRTRRGFEFLYRKLNWRAADNG